MSPSTPEFVPNSGASIVSKNVLEGRARLRWAVRESQANPADNGWRFLSEIDDETYLNDPANLQVTSFNSVVAIEPAVLPLLDMPVGTDLVILHEPNGVVFVDNHTGLRVEVEPPR